MKMEKAVEYLKAIILPLVKNPDKVKVNATIDQGGMGIMLNVIAADEDLAFLIGKQGVTARCIRHLVKGWGEQNKARILLHIGNPIQQP